MENTPCPLTAKYKFPKTWFAENTLTFDCPKEVCTFNSEFKLLIPEDLNVKHVFRDCQLIDIKNDETSTASRLASFARIGYGTRISVDNQIELPITSIRIACSIDKVPDVRMTILEGDKEVFCHFHTKMLRISIGTFNFEWEADPDDDTMCRTDCSHPYFSFSIEITPDKPITIAAAQYL